MLVYFGYPAAHEDDAQRAVRAGLEILAALPQLNRQLQPTVGATHTSPLQVRIGSHTGLVVVGEIGSGDKREILALGETPNIAARLQGPAAPDTVVISTVTARLVQNAFALEELGTLQARLAQLVAAELLYQWGRPPRVRYVFKHALIQEAAYASMLKSVHQRAHQQIAQLFVQHLPEVVDTQPEVVAHRYTEAGLTAQAISYWQQAGQGAIQRSANTEAINHLSKGLELLKLLPDTPERTQQELGLQTMLGPALIATKTK